MYNIAEFFFDALRITTHVVGTSFTLRIFCCVLLTGALNVYKGIISLKGDISFTGNSAGFAGGTLIGVLQLDFSSRCMFLFVNA